MKKLVYLSLSVLLALSYSCDKDEILTEEESRILEQKSVIGTDNFKIQQRNSQTPSTDQDGVSLENLYRLYLNMDVLENEYTNDPSNPSFDGPFNLYYRDLMANYFTIYEILESTNSDLGCANVERWVVDINELNIYLISIGEDEVTEGGIGGPDPNTGNTTGGNTSNTATDNTGLTDTNGKTKTSQNTDNDDDSEEDSDEIPSLLALDYMYCFTL